VLGKRLPPLQSHTLEWVRDWVRVIAALHHTINHVEKPSLDGIRHHDPDTSPITYLSSSHLFPSSSSGFIVSSQSTISLQPLPPYPPWNDTSISVASYGCYHVRSPDLRFLPQCPPSLRNQSLQFNMHSRLIAAPNWISTNIQLQAPILHHYSLHVHIQARLITASKCISTPARLQPPSCHNICLQVHLQTCLFTYSKSVSKVVWFWLASLHDRSFNAHSITVWNCLMKFTRSLSGDTIELEGRQPIINTTLPHLR